MKAVNALLAALLTLPGASWRAGSPSPGARRSVVIGKDTRLTGYMLETALTAGITSMGVDVLLVGPLPTPGIAFITRSLRADAGVVISASHNPFEDNGIKFFSGDGMKLPDAQEARIEEMIARGERQSVLADHLAARGFCALAANGLALAVKGVTTVGEVEKAVMG